MADQTALTRIRRQLALTRAGLWAERITQAFWPAWSAAFAAIAVWASDVIPDLWEGSLLIGLALLALALVAYGIRQFRSPSPGEAEARLDETLPGQPIATLQDDLTIGAGDTGSNAVWQAHRDRLAARLDQARAVAPDLRVSPRDPYALRYMAVLLAAVALTFGTLFRVPAAPVVPVGGEAVATGPAWEGWLQPPRHTGLPTLYLNEIDPGPIDIPEGTTITLRLYGERGNLSVAETVSGRTEFDPTEPMQEFEVTRSGTLSINGSEDDPIWSLSLLPDQPPVIRLGGAPDFEHPETMTMPWEAEDEYGVVAARVTFALDLDGIDRRHGLTVDPDGYETIELDMSLPISGNRDKIAETFRANLIEHPLSGMPVTVVIEADDALGQTGTFETQFVLPGKPFYDTFAAALVEQRRDLFWAMDNRARVARLLRATTWKADDTFNNPAAYLIVRMAIRRLDDAAAWSPEVRDEVADMLWQAALRLEENSLDGALQRLQQARDRLSEAIRNGATPEEIARLTEEMRRAMDEYTRQLAETQQPQQGQQQAQGETQEITPDMLDQMMQRIEELMRQGRVAEAQELLQQLQEMMENLRVTQGGEGGQGQQQAGQGEQAMDELRETLRDQQGLSDDAFRELQEQFNPDAQSGESAQNEGSSGGQGRGTEHTQNQGQQGQGQQQGGQEGEGQQQGQQQGGAGQGQQQGQPGGGSETSPEGLARRQGALRRQLDALRDGLPQLGGESAQRAEDALDRAGRAMDDAERDLADGNLGGALSDQARALDALRDGLQELGRALAEQRQDGQPGEGQQQGNPSQQAGDPFQRDPLGRRSGDGARLGTEEQFLDGPSAVRRAQDLLDEIRRRSGEQDRPEVELDYLRRLLERF